MAERTRRHQEYIDLYRTLGVRYAGDLYPRAEAVNVHMLSAAETAPDETEFKRRVWTSTLAIEVTTAIMRDVAEAEARLWDELGDPVRARGAREAFAALDGVVNILTLIEVEAASEVRRAWEERLDALTALFAEDFAALEDIEVWERADVPDEWGDELARLVDGRLAEGQARWQQITAWARQLDPSWDFHEADVWETRHRRRIPFPDHVLTQRLEQHRRYRGA